MLLVRRNHVGRVDFYEACRVLHLLAVNFYLPERRQINLLALRQQRLYASISTISKDEALSRERQGRRLTETQNIASVAADRVTLIRQVQLS
jgi:hypothetical protein